MANTIHPLPLFLVRSYVCFLGIAFFFIFFYFLSVLMCHKSKNGFKCFCFGLFVLKREKKKKG
jgi:hypothetical protein